MRSETCPAGEVVLLGGVSEFTAGYVVFVQSENRTFTFPLADYQDNLMAAQAAAEEFFQCCVAHGGRSAGPRPEDPAERTDPSAPQEAAGARGRPR